MWEKFWAKMAEMKEFNAAKYILRFEDSWKISITISLKFSLDHEQFRKMKLRKII